MATNTIVVKGRGIRKERQAAAAINPGHLLELVSTGKVKVHAGAAKNASSMFAIENDLIGNAVTDGYVTDDNVLYESLPPGSEVYARLAAAATAVTVGAFMESAGDGTLRILTTDTATDNTQRNSVVGVALEAVDNSAGSAEVFVLVEVQ